MPAEEYEEFILYSQGACPINEECLVSSLIFLLFLFFTSICVDRTDVGYSDFWPFTGFFSFFFFFCWKPDIHTRTSQIQLWAKRKTITNFLTNKTTKNRRIMHKTVDFSDWNQFLFGFFSFFGLNTIFTQYVYR